MLTRVDWNLFSGKTVLLGNLSPSLQFQFDYMAFTMSDSILVALVFWGLLQELSPK